MAAFKPVNECASFVRHGHCDTAPVVSGLRLANPALAFHTRNQAGHTGQAYPGGIGQSADLPSGLRQDFCDASIGSVLICISTACLWTPVFSSFSSFFAT